MGTNEEHEHTTGWRAFVLTVGIIGTVLLLPQVSYQHPVLTMMLAFSPITLGILAAWVPWHRLRW